MRYFLALCPRVSVLEFTDLADRSGFTNTHLALEHSLVDARTTSFDRLGAIPLGISPLLL